MTKRIDPEIANLRGGSELRILIADDNRMVRELTGDLLKSLGTTPFLAKDGRTALDLVRGQNFSLLLLDIRMPGLGGLEVARIVRDNPQIYGTPALIGLSAANDLSLAGECLQAGMNRLLQKPVSVGDLRELLLTWCFSSAPTAEAL